MKEQIVNKIKDLITKVVGTDATVDVLESESFLPKNSLDKTIWFKVKVKDPRFYISNQADALLALNHLAKKITENNFISNTTLDGGQKEFFDLLIDINDFHKRKIEAIQATVHMMAERARYFKSNIEIDPMSAFERKIVHEFLADATDLKTESQGEGHQRRVIIKYIGDSV